MKESAKGRFFENQVSHVLFRCNPLRDVSLGTGYSLPYLLTLILRGSKLIQRIEENEAVEGKLNVDIVYSMKCTVYSV